MVIRVILISTKFGLIFVFFILFSSIAFSEAQVSNIENTLNNDTVLTKILFNYTDNKDCEFYANITVQDKNLKKIYEKNELVKCNTADLSFSWPISNLNSEYFIRVPLSSPAADGFGYNPFFTTFAKYTPNYELAILTKNPLCSEVSNDVKITTLNKTTTISNAQFSFGYQKLGTTNTTSVKEYNFNFDGTYTHTIQFNPGLIKSSEGYIFAALIKNGTTAVVSDFGGFYTQPCNPIQDTSKTDIIDNINTAQETEPIQMDLFITKDNFEKNPGEAIALTAQIRYYDNPDKINTFWVSKSPVFKVATYNEAKAVVDSYLTAELSNLYFPAKNEYGFSEVNGQILMASKLKTAGLYNICIESVDSDITITSDNCALIKIIASEEQNTITEPEEQNTIMEPEEQKRNIFQIIWDWIVSLFS